ncbi:hypothetical protein SK128_005345 [Halocaridina rubra]|uniref:Uncharacterized protein n=1 Tax=Halocaridina rubra TaxID=373956 RepID=A0AAN8ZZG9_HALRR
MDVLECKVCYENYDCISRKPLSFFCGHTYCSACIEDMLAKGISGCPGCRKPHLATDLQNLPVNYSIMELLEAVEQTSADTLQASLSETLVKPPQTSAGICEDHGNYLVFFCDTCEKWICRDCTIIDHQDSKGHIVVSIKAALAKRKHNSLKEITNMENSQEQLHNNFHIYLEELKTETTLLEKLSKNVKKAIQFSFEEQDRVKKVMAEGEHLRLQISAAQHQLNDVMTYDDMNTAFSRLGECKNYCEKWTSESNQLLMSLDNKNNFFKWALMMTNMAENKDSKSKTPFIYLIHQDKIKPRFAAIELKNGRLHLYSLQNTIPPSDALIFPYERVREMIGVAGALAFFKLSWHDNKGGFIYIRIGEYSRRADNFLLLCTGEHGPSYAGSTFQNIYYIGRCGEYIEAGDYEKNDGTGGLPLLEELEYAEQVKQTITCGTVAGKDRHKKTASMFRIYTKDSPGYFDRIFAHIESGFDVMREAVKQKTIGEVMIRECGVVLAP